MELHKLSKSQNINLAKIKGGAVLSLLSLLPQIDEESKNIIRNKKITVQFIVPRGESLYLEITGGNIQLQKGFKWFPSFTMLFPGPTDFNKLFLSAGGKLLPLPGSFKFLSAVKTFQSLMKRLQELMNSSSDQENSLILLLNAALEGVCRVAMFDSYVEKRIGRIPDGLIEVAVDGTDINCSIVKKGLSFKRICKMKGEKANARLLFKDVKTALGVFTGKIDATVALGMTDISIRGRLSMIQGLFPLLDRFGFYMAVTKDGEK